MKPMALKMNCALALLVAAILTAGPVMADKSSKGDGGKGGKNERSDRRDDNKGDRRNDNEGSHRDRDGDSGAKRGHFESRQQVIVRDYYGEQFRGGRCPPGLAKKHNGCMPPGQAKKWKVGQHLPRDVIYYSVPQALVVQIGQPPSGHRYVRVDSDILMLVIGTGMVVDAIQNLGR